MSGRLRKDEMNQLESWIGNGPKTFTLLYAITRDGCNSKTFQQKCDNQGATVTVLYSQQGCVYGGYASASWNSKGNYVSASDSFLFQLQYNGISALNKFDLEENSLSEFNECALEENSLYALNEFHLEEKGYSIYCHSSYGPTFGSGHDLLTFTKTVNNAGGYFPLNGGLNIRNSYYNREITENSINNGTMNVIELEVYVVTDDKRKFSEDQPKKEAVPWRKTKVWNEQYLNELVEDIVQFKPVEGVKVTEARIVMIGPVGSGKSSFYNTIDSVFRGRITQRAKSGSAQQSLTTTYTPFTVNVQSGAKLNFRLCDTRELEESSGMTDVELNYLLEGNVPDFYQFNPSTPFSPKTPGFKSDPAPNDEIHCAVFVLDSTTRDVLSSRMTDRMKRFQEIMNQKGIPQFVLLTKVDKLCNEVERDISCIFKSEAVGKQVEKAAQIFGLPPVNILPVKNYVNEDDLDVNVSILALLALRKIVNFTGDYFCNVLQHRKHMEKEMGKMTVKN